MSDSPKQVKPGKPHGVILKLKQGYNPNSSSVGSQVPGFLAAAGAICTSAVFVLHVIRPLAARLRKRLRPPDHMPRKEQES